MGKTEEKSAKLKWEHKGVGIFLEKSDAESSELIDGVEIEGGGWRLQL